VGPTTECEEKKIIFRGTGKSFGGAGRNLRYYLAQRKG